MNKSEQAYRLKCAGLTNSEIAKQIGSARKSVPTMAKNHMNRYGLPHWSEEGSFVTASDSGNTLESIRDTIDGLSGSVDLTMGQLMLLADIAGIAGEIVSRARQVLK